MSVTSRLKSIGCTAAILGMTLLPGLASAQSNGGGFLGGGGMARTIAGRTGVSTADSTQLPVIIGNFINALLSLLGFVLLFFMLYAGFLWMTAQGDSKQVDKAKGMIRDAIIGLVIIALSFTLTSFVLRALTQAVPAGTGSGAGGAVNTPGTTQ